MIKHLQHFCETKRILPEPKRYYQEYLLKRDLPRNLNESHHHFGKLFNKYIELNEELDARWKKQASFLDEMQVLAEQRSRPAKAEKDFRNREKRQTKLERISAQLAQDIRTTDFQLLALWLQFNNYTCSAPMDEACRSYSPKFAPFRVGLPNNLGLALDARLAIQIGRTANQTEIDQIIMKPSFGVHQVLTHPIEHSQRFILNCNKIQVDVCADTSEAKRAQLQSVTHILGQLKSPILYKAPDLLLAPYEANRIEIVAESDGLLKRVAYSFNTLNHLTQRYFRPNQEYIVFTVLE